MSFHCEDGRNRDQAGRGARSAACALALVMSMQSVDSAAQNGPAPQAKGLGVPVVFVTATPRHAIARSVAPPDDAALGRPIDADEVFRIEQTRQARATRICISCD